MLSWPSTETSHSRHIALLNDVKYLATAQRDIVLNRQRDVVAAFARQLTRAYPEHVNRGNQTPLTMMVFGMINWTFTWLKPGGPMGYGDFAEARDPGSRTGFARRRAGPPPPRPEPRPAPC